MKKKLNIAEQFRLEIINMYSKQYMDCISENVRKCMKDRKNDDGKN